MGPIWVLHGAKVQVDFKSKLTLECSERGPMKDPAPALALKLVTDDEIGSFGQLLKSLISVKILNPLL